MKNQFNEICQKYIDAFSKKQNMEFDFWVGDYVGEIAVFGDFYFDFFDIRLDIDTNQPAEKIIDWNTDCVLGSVDNNSHLNYRTYIKL